MPRGYAWPLSARPGNWLLHFRNKHSRILGRSCVKRAASPTRLGCSKSGADGPMPPRSGLRCVGGPRRCVPRPPRSSHEKLECNHCCDCVAQRNKCLSEEGLMVHSWIYCNQFLSHFWWDVVFDRWSSGMFTCGPHRVSPRKALREFLQEA